MSFVKLMPGSLRSKVPTRDKIRIQFKKFQGKMNAVLLIGTDIAKRVGFTKDDVIGISIHEDDNLVWLLQKDPIGWKLSDINHSTKTKSLPLYRLQLAWKGQVPEKLEDGVLKFASWDIFEGGLRIFLPGAKNESKML